MKIGTRSELDPTLASRDGASVPRMCARRPRSAAACAKSEVASKPTTAAAASSWT
jgi:hypothetical protein